MPLYIKPHRLLVRPVDVPLDDFRTAMVATHLPEQIEMQGKAEPLGSDAAFQKWGVELTEPYRVMVDLGSEVHFKVGALVRVEPLGEWLKVAQAPTRHGATVAASHAVILCQKVSPPEGS